MEEIKKNLRRAEKDADEWEMDQTFIGFCQPALTLCPNPLMGRTLALERQQIVWDSFEQQAAPEENDLLQFGKLL